MQRFWPGRRLHELTTGEMTWRELRTFLRHLPRDSAYARSVHGEQSHREHGSRDRAC